MFQTFLTYLAAHHQAVLELLGGAAGISVLLESLLLKLKNKWHIDSKKLAFTLLNLFTGLTAILTPFVTSIPMKNAPAVYASLALIAQAWHRFVISPAYTKWVTPFLEYQAGRKGQTSTQTQPSLDPTGSVEPEQFLGQ